MNQTEIDKRIDAILHQKADERNRIEMNYQDAIVEIEYRKQRALQALDVWMHEQGLQLLAVAETQSDKEAIEKAFGLTHA